MSVSLLIPLPTGPETAPSGASAPGGALARPTLIPRDMVESLRASADIAAIISEETALLDHFTLDTIRIAHGRATDPISASDRITKLVKKPALAPAMRAPAVLFLSLVYDYAMRGRIVLVTRQPASFASALADDIKRLFPSARVVLHCADDVGLLYEVAAATFDVSPPEERTYLLSLGTTLAHHRDLVQHFQPAHALMGINTAGAKSFLFYPGELWIPPFGGSASKVAYLRTDFVAAMYDYDPTLKGRLWDAELISAAMERFCYITNERVAYADPMGVDRYLFGVYPNDYSHMFCYAALMTYLDRLNVMPTEKALLAAYEMMVREV